ERMPTPQDGQSYATDLLSTIDDRTAVFVERSGRSCAIDLQTGDLLWTIHAPVDRAYDASVSSGWLVISGDQQIVGPGGAVQGWRPEIVVLDARTGQELQRLPQRWGQVRWVRFADSGDLIAGCEQAITSIDLSRAQVNWVISDPHMIATRDAWAFG